MREDHSPPRLFEREERLHFQLGEACSACANHDDFARIVRTIARELLPHSSLIATLGRIDLDHVEIVHVAEVDYPEGGIEALRRITNIRERLALMHWLRTREPLVLDLEHDAHMMSELEQHEIRKLELGRVAAHGVLDFSARSGSYLSFAGVEREASRASICDRLRLIVPHLHQAFIRTIQQAQSALPAKRSTLTETECHLLKLVAAGRTNAEIAKARGRSEATVRNQLTVVFRKLGVRNRAEAVRVELSRL
jgi:DNA-binding CsgD family transcriptional regulator